MKIAQPVIVSIAAILIVTGCNKSDPSLEVAVMDGDIGSVETQIAAGADVNLPADNPPLYVATAFAGDLLRDSRPDMRAKEKDYTKIVQLLVSAGADLDARDSAGDTALARAARSGHEEIVRLLISNGADVNLLLYSGKTKTALDRALSAGESGTAAIIREHGGKTRAELETEKWQRDIGQFNAMLRKLVETADLPEKEALKKEIESKSGRAEVLTDGRGGVVDFNAAKGTIQHEANKLIGSGGPHIDWEFELAGGSKVNDDKSAWFAPKIAQIVNDGDGKKERFRLFISIEETDAGPFKAGDRIRLRASIDDFSRFEKRYREATGLVAIYYLDDAPNPFFELKLDKAEVTLLEANTSEQGGADQPATAPESKLKGDEKPQPESEVPSR